MKLQSTNTISTTNGVKLFVYGKTGSQKTRMCATAPNPVIISTESGLLSLRQYNLPFVEAVTLTDVENYTKQLMSSQFATICIDSLSAAATRELARIIPSYKNKMQAYGEIAERIEALMWQIQRSQGKHFYITAHLDTYQDEMGAVMFGPQFPGKHLSKSSPYIFDEIFYAHKVKVADNKEIIALRTQMTNTIEAKDRSGALNELEEPNIANIISKIAKG
jgi:hypothetical protein